MILAANQLNQIIACLADGQITRRLGHRVTERKLVPVDAGYGARLTTRRDELLHGPRLAFIERHGREQSVAGEFRAVAGLETHAFALRPIAQLVGERAE